MKISVLFAALCLIAAPAFAKLPPPTPEQAATAEAAKTKAAETAKKDAELLAKYQDRAVENFKRNTQAKNATATTTTNKKP